jgi:ATP-dependent exoDNAse (exonuclease V) beta subunit
MDINEIKFKIKNKQKEIAFYEDTHEYFYKGNKLPSVSSYIEKYSHPFDPEGTITKRVAERNGISPEQQKERWNKIAEEACEIGTKIHLEHEEMLQGIREPNELIKTLFQAGIEVIDTEIILFNKVLAGQCDALVYDKYRDKIILIDFKTNKKIPSPENKYKKFMKEPYGILPDTSYGHYTLQLSIYRHLLINWGVPVEECKLIHLSGDEYTIIDIEPISIKLE